MDAKVQKTADKSSARTIQKGNMPNCMSLFVSLFYSSDIRHVPDFGLGTGGAYLQVADLQEEITLFEDPFAVGSYEGEGLGWQLEGDGLGLACFEGDLREVTQALVVRHNAGDEV